MATCFDSTESSSSPCGVDPYRECPTHCGMPNAHNNITEVQSSIQQRVDIRGGSLC